MATIGAAPRLDGDGRVVCPYCGNNHVRPGAVRYYYREQEDGPTATTVCNGIGSTTLLGVDDHPGWLTAVGVFFSCVQCEIDGLMPIELVLYEYERQTYSEWRTTLPMRELREALRRREQSPLYDA